MMNDDIDVYLNVRAKEGRLYSDEVVKRLPAVPEDHPLRSEWGARAASSERLVAYLRRSRRPVTILDLGCGNGWLSHRMACSGIASVVGLDRDSPELRQACRVFSSEESLSWISADVFLAPFASSTFDFIVIASAIQYFADLPCLVIALLPLLAAGGEIHILDSPLYSVEEWPAARERSKHYYERLGFPEMASRYHHHISGVLDAYNPTWLYVPQLEDRARRDQLRDSPFPWICLRPGR
jgi:SAM-dependent methyltransferase